MVPEKIPHEAVILATFSHLVSEGKIRYDANQRIVKCEDRGLPFEFRISSALTGKPVLGETPPTKVSEDEPQLQLSSGLAPGSDINVTGLEICEVNGTHILAFNKFCVYKPHLLLLTVDGFRRQTESLNEQDLDAAWSSMAELSAGAGHDYFVLYNCGEAGGCSRSHKHLQLIPHPCERFPLWPGLPDGARPPVPFKFFLNRLGTKPSSRDLVVAYEEMMRGVRETLQLGEDGHAPHNVVLTRDWILVVPRSKVGYKGAYSNASAIVGQVWLKSAQDLDLWMQVGPTEALTQAGVKDSSFHDQK